MSVIIRAFKWELMGLFFSSLRPQMYQQARLVQNPTTIIIGTITRLRILITRDTSHGICPFIISWGKKNWCQFLQFFTATYILMIYAIWLVMDSHFFNSFTPFTRTLSLSVNSFAYNISFSLGIGPSDRHNNALRLLFWSRHPDGYWVNISGVCIPSCWHW